MTSGPGPDGNKFDVSCFGLFDNIPFLSKHRALA